MVMMMVMKVMMVMMVIIMVMMVMMVVTGGDDVVLVIQIKLDDYWQSETECSKCNN